MTPDERAIRDLIATWLAASATGDSAKVLTLMSDDVIFLVAGRSFGKEEFSASQSVLATHRLETSSDVREVVVAGDLAYARTELTVTMTPLAGGPSQRRTGPTLSIFRRGPDGRWVLTRDANLLARG